MAERLASETGEPVTYLATAEAVDEDMAARIARHRSDRPAAWTTVEVGSDLAHGLADLEGTVLVECLGTWLARLPDFNADIDELVVALRKRDGHTIVVSNEVGMGVHPYTELGRQFRDALGSVNRRVADISDEVLLVVAGRALRLDRY